MNIDIKLLFLGFYVNRKYNCNTATPQDKTDTNTPPSIAQHTSLTANSLPRYSTSALQPLPKTRKPRERTESAKPYRCLYQMVGNQTRTFFKIISALWKFMRTFAP